MSTAKANSAKRNLKEQFEALLASFVVQEINSDELQASLAQLLRPWLISRSTTHALSLLSSPEHKANIKSLETLESLNLDHAIPKERRKREGIDYTPNEVACTLASEALKSKQKDWVLFDPACGNGQLIMAALELMRSELPQDAKQLAELLSKRVVALDIDPLAILITQIRIQGFIREVSGEDIPISADYIRCADFLFDSSAKELAQSLAPGAQLITVSNPPFGLKRTQAFTEEQNRALKQRFKELKLRKVNKYLAFLASLITLDRDAQRIAILVPDTFASIVSSQEIRRLLIKAQQLEAIIKVPKSAFAGRAVETLIALIDKEQTSEAIRILSEQGETLDNIPLSFLSSAPGAVIPLNSSQQIRNSLEEIAENSVALGSELSPFRASIALQAYATGKGEPPQTVEDVKAHRFHAETAVDESFLPYLEGKQIRALSYGQPKSYLSWGPWLAEPGDIESYRKPRVIIREVLSRYPQMLRATYCEGELLYNKSILHIHSKEKASNEMLRALAVFLQSRLISFWLFHRGRKSQRKLFPKVLEFDLSSLPLPSSVASLEKFLEFEQQALQKLRNIQDAIDEEAFKLFKLSEEAKRTIRSFEVN